MAVFTCVFITVISAFAISDNDENWTPSFLRLNLYARRYIVHICRMTVVTNCRSWSVLPQTMESAQHASNCGSMNNLLPEISRETTLIGLCYWPCDLRLILLLTVTLVFRRLEFSLRHRQMSRRLLRAVLAKGRRLVLLVFQKSHNFIFQNGCEGN